MQPIWLPWLAPSVPAPFHLEWYRVLVGTWGLEPWVERMGEALLLLLLSLVAW